MEKKSASFVFGLHPIEEAFVSGKEFEKILIQQGNRSEKINEIIRQARTLDYPVQYVPLEKLNRITRKNHQGIIGFVSPISYQPVEQLIPGIYEEGRMPFLLILDKVTDVRNFGAIARSAYAAGVDAILIPSRGSALINADAMKTAAGALNHLAVCRTENLKDSIDFLKNSGLRIAAISEKSEKTIWETDLSGPIALMLGSEEDGISPAYLQKTDIHLRIPMPKPIDSLNVSVAAGIACFEVVRQRIKA
ncbi:MAG: 23S rRNA (guanosine(2251)-2'-O)-methyltransferase RlmB [Bacteroidales bacterium]|jgi:23S rRNA (guanosine2251-2'-O)-methyltransferase|nr:23S rRNA (guanosine(2251)-2'-O)-methyltransferase RlmB [Bacteroidales bacterium]MDN5349104.1 rRNA (guanosine2251-2-O)-methyltransferase [Bacteroidales bacterium]